MKIISEEKRAKLLREKLVEIEAVAGCLGNRMS